MSALFDYTYYKLCLHFIKQKDEGYSLAAVFALSFFHFLNITVVLVIFSVFLFGYTPSNSAPIAIVLGVIVVVLNGIRYNKLHFKILDERFNSETITRNAQRENAMIWYILITVISAIVLIARKRIFEVFQM